MLVDRGVLFLDELAEFDRLTLDALRQPDLGLLREARADLEDPEELNRLPIIMLGGGRWRPERPGQNR